ncbi:MAG TPA: hypothetical protein DEA22_07170 [Blastocatellia bacterium]|nr:hypothetical protein [Blastocatellia bacterium]
MQDVEAFILAGGRSSRMGRDKSLLEIGGRTFLALIGAELERITPGGVRLVGGSGPSDHFQRVPDIFPASGRAALVGLHAALFHSQAPWVIIVGCDMPFVRAALFDILLSRISPDVDAVVPVDGKGKTQPLCAVYRRDRCLAAAEAALCGNNWSLGGFLDGIKTIFVPFEEFANVADPEILFSNINTGDDLLAAIERRKQIGEG